MSGTGALDASDVAQLVQAATNAAQAAADAVAELRALQASRGERSGFQEASKVVRQPEPFGSEVHEDDLSKWQDFSVNFKAWLFYGNSAYEVDLHRAEQHGSNPAPPLINAESTETQERCKQLYSILTGVLRGKPLRLLRQVEQRNGFEVWRQLCQVYMPRTKSRAISLLTALMNAPSFTKERTLLDQVLGLERLRAEYVRASGLDVQDDIMLSVLVKALPKAIQQHVQLQMSESSTYSQVRSLVVGYETVTTTWSANKIHAELGILPTSSSSTTQSNQPVPMEIDRFEKGGKKGKQKGKSKGKDGFKGKSKSKFDKGKGKGGKSPNQSKPRAATPDDQCLHCGKWGHFKRDCWKLRGKPSKVNQVADDSQSLVSGVSGTTNASAATASTLPSSASAVRLFSSMPEPIIEELCSGDELNMYDLTMYDSTAGSYCMVSQLDSEDSSCDGAYMSSCLQYDMSYSDNDGIWTCFDDACSCSDFTAVSCVDVDVDVSCIRALGYDSSSNVEVVLDSGADGSVLPLEYGHVGYHDPEFNRASSFVDAQGNPINVTGARIAEVRFGSIVFKERFIIAAVTSPLICMGKLLKDGWDVRRNGSKIDLVRGSASIPLHFKRHSLCSFGQIRMLASGDDEPCAVRAIQLGDRLAALGRTASSRGWMKINDSVYALHSNSPYHVDTTYCPSDSLLWLRTTLVRLEDGNWQVDEYWASISDMSSRVMPIQAEKPVLEVITIAHDGMVPPEVLGFQAHEDVVQPVRPSALFASAPSSSSAERPSDERPPAVVRPPVANPEAERPDPVPAAPGGAEAMVEDRVDDVDTTEVIVEGVKMDSNTPLRTLRSACESLGLSKGGGKQKCLKRLWHHLQSQELIASHAAERGLRGDLVRPANPQVVPKEPSAEQIAEHCLTHYPFAAWCDLCIANKAQQDGHVQQDHVESGHSCISFDFGYANRFDGEEKACALYIHDRHTGAMHVVPTPQKGGRYLNHLCTEFCRFIVWLGHDVISLKCDQEPATLSLLDAVKKTCRCLGIRASGETVPVGSHASNGAAEVTVKVIRRQANLLIQQIEKGCHIQDVIGCQHPLYHWALLHSAWLHNRFVVKQGKTAYELCADRVYSGRIAMFGECVMGFLKTSFKGAPQWVKGIWLGKTMNNDVHIVAVPGSP